MSYREIRYDVAERIAIITLHRPERMNAFTHVMRDELVDAFGKADADDEVRAVVVTGAGRAFCAGADLAAGASTFDYTKGEGLTVQTHRDGGGMVSLRIFEMKKPVIAAVNGAAVGIGATMLLPMDVRIASTDARFGFVFARRGIVPEACSSWFLPRVVGVGQALEWTLSGRVFGAAEALGGRLVSKVVAPDALLPTARALAKEIAANTAPVAVALARQMMWRMLGADHPMEAHKVDSRGIFTLGASPDVTEGIAAFKEKRAPRFPMRVSADMPAFYPWWKDRKFE
jgi:enoyl-CoA hydratase/carnithine racemase